MIWGIEEEKNEFKKAKLKVSAERKIKQLQGDEQRISYAMQVLKLYSDYEEMVFNLSEQSANETIESIKRMSLGQRMKFQELIIKKNRPKANG